MLCIPSNHPSLPVLAGAILVGVLTPGVSVAAKDNLSGVTVTAPRLIGRDTIGAPIERVSMSAIVRVADLDLRTPRGVRELNKRVREVAASLCKRLEADYPIGSPEYTACIKEAITDASSQTNLIKVAD